MICKKCAQGADENKPELHGECKDLHCTCQHRTDAVVIKKDGANVKENNGDGS